MRVSRRSQVHESTKTIRAQTSSTLRCDPTRITPRHQGRGREETKPPADFRCIRALSIRNFSAVLDRRNRKMDRNSIISFLALVISVGVAIFTILNARYLQKKEHIHQIKLSQREKLEDANTLMEKKVRMVNQIMNTLLSKIDSPPEGYIEEKYREIICIYIETRDLYNAINYCFHLKSRENIDNKINNIETILKEFIDKKNTDFGMVEMAYFIEFFWEETKKHLQRP